MVAVVAIALASVALASAAYAASRQSYYQATYGNYAPNGGYDGEGSYGQAPDGYGYPQQEYGYGHGYQQDMAVMAA